MINNQPTFTAPTLPEFRKKSSSSLFNTAFEDIEFDITTLYNSSTYLRLFSFDNSSALSSQITSLSSKLDSIEATLASLETTILAQSKAFYYNAFSSTYLCTDYPEYNTAVADTEYGKVYSDELTSISKLGAINSGTNEFDLYADLSIIVDSIVSSVDQEDGGTVISTPTERMVDSDNNTYYERKVIFPATSSKVEVKCRVTITLPRVSNPNINCISVDPLPVFSTNVENIQYSTLSAPSVFNSIPEFVAGDTNQKVLFNSVEPYKIRFIISQSNFTIEDGYKVFKYGLHNIDIRLLSYQDTSTELFKFTLPASLYTNFSELNLLETTPVITDGIQYLIYPTADALTSDSSIWNSLIDAPISSTYPLDLVSFSTSTVFVKALFTKKLSTTPYIKDIRIEYEVQ